MKKKLAIGGVVLVVLIVGGYLGFQWYLSVYKAESEVVKVEAKEVETKEETSAGVEINSMADLDGKYFSEVTEKVSSEILFKIGGSTSTQGTFKDFEIVFEHSESAKSISVNIDPSSVYTAESTRDKHLKEDKFFDVAKYPKIEFSSNEIIKGDTSYIAKGQIKFMGVKSDLDVPFNYIGQSSEDENIEIFEGKFDFNRVKYGMQEASGIENEVTISFYCALRKK